MIAGAASCTPIASTLPVKRVMNIAPGVHPADNRGKPNAGINSKLRTSADKNGRCAPTSKNSTIASCTLN